MIEVKTQKGSQILEESGNIPTTRNEKNQEPTLEKKNKKDTLIFRFSAATAYLIMETIGFNLVWTPLILPDLRNNDTNINPLGEPIEISEMSLLIGLPLVMYLSSIFFMVKLPNFIGRIETMKYMSIGMVFANIAVAFGTHINFYYIARSIFIVFAGSALLAVQLYLREIVEDHNREKTMPLMYLALPNSYSYSFIVILMASLGNFEKVQYFTSILCTVPLVISLIFLYTFVPESPVYLAMKEKEEETMKTLRKLRSNKSNKEIEQDYLKIEDVSKSRMESEKSGFLNLFKTPALREDMIVALVANITQHLSGVAVIMPFLGPIFMEAHTQPAGYILVILLFIGCTVTLSVFLLIRIINKRMRKRALLLFSFCSTGISLILHGLYFFSKTNNISFIENIRLLPVLSIITYVVVYFFGLGPYSLLMVELFPSDLKSAATFLNTIIVTFLMIVTSTVFPIAVEYIGIHWCIWTFSFFSFLGSCFVYFKLPEMKG
ncbi:facilitated trehalose transporter Tret1 isoform X1 [Leptinotarsa decemlineata]|uniref:facilitated trehalose transporter Tret1 isoform X1 n=1 Tax=Leptinotarsa decemlineata TaxID=7539 RepID=UPI003D30B7EA